MAVMPRWPVRPGIVVVGASTGGPAALKALLAELPASFPLPVLVAQHMPAEFTPMLAGSLDENVALETAQAVDGEFIRPGRVLVAPGGHHMTVTDAGSVHLQADQRPETVCPSVDLLFSSAAKVYRAAVLAVVLTGMGNDGLAGAQDVVDAGGLVLAQDEATSVVWGMPGIVVAGGLASVVGSPRRLGAEIVTRAGWR